ncbi:hypothetical protein ABZV29_38225 [Streptomyces sp. NPDC005236]|uniref:hypothetical protein n=1 Tax=Streptomyces sp. NPDC005236 TaxID=3157028 RepID=UPI0033AD43A7
MRAGGRAPLHLQPGHRADEPHQERWAKNGGIAGGPGRGSAGGSIVASTLGTTDLTRESYVENGSLGNHEGDIYKDDDLVFLKPTPDFSVAKFEDFTEKTCTRLVSV